MYTILGIHSTIRVQSKSKGLKGRHVGEIKGLFISAKYRPNGKIRIPEERKEVDGGWERRQNLELENGPPISRNIPTGRSSRNS